jgi:hypothetical protein
MRNIAMLAVAAAAVILFLALRPSGEPSVSQPRVSEPYRGLATWLDNWDWRAWAAPEDTKLARAVVARMQGHGVGTLFIATSHHSQADDLIRPAAIASFLEAAHARNMKVVAWYQPSLTDLNRDLSRALAAIRFRSPKGERFDSFALDIEARLVRPAARRNRRLVRLATLLRRAAGDSYVLGAIVPSPQRLDLHPNAWPQFPYRELAQQFDIFLPMAYWTYESSAFAGSRQYVAETIGKTRSLAGEPGLPIHVIGGTARFANAAEVRGFLVAASSGRVLGASMYDFLTTSSAEWGELSRWARR